MIAFQLKDSRCFKIREFVHRVCAKGDAVDPRQLDAGYDEAVV